jgi:hypothetical protein
MTIRIPIDCDPPPYELRASWWPRMMLTWVLGGVANPVAIFWTVVLRPGSPPVSVFASAGFWLVWLPTVIAASLAIPIRGLRPVRSVGRLAVALMCLLWTIIAVALAGVATAGQWMTTSIPQAILIFLGYAGLMAFFGAFVAAFAGLPAALYWAAIVRWIVFKPRPGWGPTPTNSSDPVQPSASTLRSSVFG